MNDTIQSAVDTNEITRIFRLQQEYAPTMSKTTARQRIERLDRIADFIQQDRQVEKINAAMDADFRKPAAEVMLSELVLINSHIRFIKKQLHRWIKPKRVPVNLGLLGTSNYIYYEPKGVCLVIAPWNYPFSLAILPVVYAIAAGNAVIVKPSELTANVSSYIKDMITELFPEEEVAVIEGGVPVATALLEQPFNHIYFTGSPRVGKIVMKAAAQHLTSVTLELGGKSPAIVDDSVDMRKIAEKTLWGKGLNAGQTCIAPDYMILQEDIVDTFVEAYGEAIQKFYDPAGEGIAQSPDMARIINDQNFERLKSLFDDAVEKGATVALGGDFDADSRYISPTILTNVNHEMEIMQEEIFGPILPIMTYGDREEIIDIVRSHHKPLSLYIASRKNDFIRYLLAETSAGGTVINDYLLGFGNPHVPFGGVNHSGIGKALGFHGFVEFSNEKGVIRRHIDMLYPLYPPYDQTVNKLLKLLRRWV